MDNAISPRIEYVIGSGIIAKGRIKIFSITAGAVAGVATTNVYDGENSKGKQLLSMGILENTAIPITFPEGAIAENGLFIGATSNTSRTTVTYIPYDI